MYLQCTYMPKGTLTHLLTCLLVELAAHLLPIVRFPAPKHLRPPGSVQEGAEEPQYCCLDHQQLQLGGLQDGCVSPGSDVR